MVEHVVESGSAAVGKALAGELAGAFRGELIDPDSPKYDDARAVWNGAVDRRPCLIARCSGTRDVVLAVGAARARGVPVSVPGGGHNVAGLGVWDGALMIDLSAMRGVRVDVARRTARAAGGAVWGDYDRETQAIGLTSPGGLQSTTGIGGAARSAPMPALDQLAGNAHILARDATAAHVDHASRSAR